MNTEEKLYRAESCQAPIGETGDYDSWIELVTPNLNLQCYDPNVEVEEVEELAEMLNKSSEMETAIKEVLELFEELDEYLSSNPKNYIGSGSILHQKIKKYVSKDDACKADA